MKRIREIEISDIAPASDKIWLKPTNSGFGLFVMLNGAWSEIVSPKAESNINAIIKQEINNVVNGAPEALDTLGEIAEKTIEIEEKLKDFNFEFDSDKTTTVSVGGLPAGTDLSQIKDISALLEAILAPAVEFTFNSVSFQSGSSSLNTATLREKGVPVKISSCVFNITDGTDQIKPSSVFVTSDGNKKYTAAETNPKTVLLDISVSSDVKFKCVATNGTKEKSKTVCIDFEDPCYYGAISIASPSDGEIKQLKKDLKRGHNFGTGNYTTSDSAISFSLSPKDQYLLVAVPSRVGPIKSIKDQNNFSYTIGEIGSGCDFVYEKRIMTVESGDTEYYVYRTDSPKTVSDMRLFFYFE